MKNTFKTLLILLLTFIFVFAFCACNNDPPNTEFSLLGDWKLFEIKNENQTLDEQTINERVGKVCFKFEQDSKGTVTIKEQDRVAKALFEWKMQDDNVIIQYTEITEGLGDGFSYPMILDKSLFKDEYKITIDEDNEIIVLKGTQFSILDAYNSDIELYFEKQ